MRKTNFFEKYFKNINNFINSLLEKNLNKLNATNVVSLFRNNKIILTFVALFVIFISYLLLPTLYKQSNISNELKIDLQNKLNIDLKFSKNIKYNLFPKPHFIVIDSAIFDNQKEISKIKKLKIFISLQNLFSSKNIEVKDLVIEKGNFNLNKNNYNFFLNLLKKNFKDGNLLIKNSNIFFKNSKDEVLFINKILKMKYYYDQKEFKNIFYSNNEIFNIPYSIKLFFNQDQSKILSKIDIDLMKLRIQDELLLNSDGKSGKSELNFKKLKYFTEYQIKKNQFNFQIFDKIDGPEIVYKGKINFKPFYSNLYGKLNKINLNFLFSTNAIITQLLKTELFNHKNIDFELNINANKVYDYNNFKNIKLNSKIQNGLIDTDKTKFEWKNFADFELIESLIFVKNGELVLDGKLNINVNDHNEVYKFLLTPKKYRKKINMIDLNFTYNFDKKIAELKDIKIDNKINLNVNKILNNVILKKDDLQNKIYFRHLLNAAIKSYAG